MFRRRLLLAFTCFLEGDTMFRKTLIAGAMALAALAAGSAHAAFNFNASGVVDQVEAPNVFDPTSYGSNVVTVNWDGLNALFGTLTIDQPYYVTYTFLGSEAGYTDSLSFTIDGQMLSNRGQAGDSVTVSNNPSMVDFVFKDEAGYSVSNADGASLTTNSPMTWGVLKGATTSVGTFDYIIGLNDSASGLKDYDDMVIGVTLTPVPEPESYALMLAGLGCMAFVGRRRKQG
jgi:hypothetical protein